MKNVFFSFVLLFTVNVLFSQQNIEFIQREVKDVEMYLAKSDKNLTLSNKQKDALHSLLEEKYNRIELVIAKKMEKLETSVAVTKIEDEFRPKIESLLSLDQRLAYAKKKKPVMLSATK